MTTPIPQPPPLPLIGNTFDVDRTLFINTSRRFSKQFGEIYQLNVFGKTVVYLCSQALAVDVSDESKFMKNIDGPLLEVRRAGGDGLFTAYGEEPAWGIAHRVLTPAFGPAALRDMFPDMIDIASQLLLKWERFGPEHVIDPTDDYTRLTFDTIALCAMSYRFNSFYKESPPPFITSMTSFLMTALQRAFRPKAIQALLYRENTQFEADIKVMGNLCDEIVDHRKAFPTDKKDLLNAMLHGKDPKTGLGLTEENIKKQMLTFIIAGHETTSGLLSFATYHAVKLPHVYAKIRQEVDSVLGNQPIGYEHLNKLEYITAHLRETLRLTPSVAQHTIKALDDTIIGNGKYLIHKGQTVFVNISEVQRDTKAWGEDADEFKPERMLDGKFEKLPFRAWTPFGNGSRSCIGRGFALQEAILVFATIFQKFDLRLADPSYTLQLKQTLTLKPLNLRIYATPREGAPSVTVQPNARSPHTDSSAPQTTIGIDAVATLKNPLTILFGSNTGSCEAFAQKLSTNARGLGFDPIIATMDSAAGKLPKKGPLVVITASFEGQPPDNAGHFVQWLKTLPESESLAGVKYGVMGCGHRDWARTFMAIPKLVDGCLESHGATRLVTRGAADAGGDSFFEDFDEWEAKFWEVIKKEFEVSSDDAAPALEVTLTAPATARSQNLRQADAGLGSVVKNVLLTAPDQPAKRHIEIALPKNAIYQAGDYLTIVPTNPPEVVRRAAARLNLSTEQEISIKSLGPTTLPVGRQVSVSEVLEGYVELSQSASKKDIQTLISFCKDQASQVALQSLVDNYKVEVIDKHQSVLDILVSYPSIEVSLSTFLQLIPAMRARNYSISSSPLWDPTTVSLTVSIVQGPALSGVGDFFGVGSTFLARLMVGDRIQVAVRPSPAAFHLPSDPTVPIVMLCAGSGLAPMRGFIQERAMQKASGRQVGRMLLFFGCRDPEKDFLYSDSDFAQWVEDGVVDIRPSFSKAVDSSNGCRYVADRVWHDRADIRAAYHAGAKFFTCGLSKFSISTKEKLVEIMAETAGVSVEEASVRFEEVSKERLATDVFG